MRTCIGYYNNERVDPRSGVSLDDIPEFRAFSCCKVGQFFQQYNLPGGVGGLEELGTSGNP